MTQTTPSASAQKIVLERTLRAPIEEIWSLWTTKDGFESWWGPEGFRVEVHQLDARAGGVPISRRRAAQRASGRPSFRRAAGCS